eukprot:6883750-Pyramimonas_sp.AAC.1
MDTDRRSTVHSERYSATPRSAFRRRECSPCSCLRTVEASPLGRCFRALSLTRCRCSARSPRWNRTFVGKSGGKSSR